MWSAYRDILRVPAARQIVVLSVFLRVPMFGAFVVLTVHVVQTLQRTYAEAGIIMAAFTIAAAISSPVRGRLLDRLGLRRTLIPSLVVQPIAWGLAPFASYWTLIVLVTLAGLFAVPSFSIIRQVLLAAVPMHRRRTALAMDAVLTETCYMIGPAVGVLVATMWHTGYTMAALQMLMIGASVVLFILDPRIIEEQGADAVRQTGFSWLRPKVAAAFLVTLTIAIAIAGADLAAVAAMRAMGQMEHVGWLLAAWGLSSALGGLLYGGWSRQLRPEVLLGGFGLTLMPLFWVDHPLVLGIVLFCNGFFIAPTFTAIMDAITSGVSAARRGEAMGWHGSCMTTGQAIGAPILGWVMDHFGWVWGFGAGAILALGVAVASGSFIRWRRGRRVRFV